MTDSSILHRDLKPDNLMVVSLSSRAPVSVKVADFGSSREMMSDAQDQMTKGVGTVSSWAVSHPSSPCTWPPYCVALLSLTPT